MIVVLAEKPSAVRNMSNALGGRSGSFEGTTYTVFSLLGPLMGLKVPEEQVAAPLRDRYGSWDATLLPWDPSDLAWEREFRDADRKKVAKELKELLSSADEVAIATDDDPSGEGELLAWEVLLWCGWKGMTTRMHFVDEAPDSIRKAFRTRSNVQDAAHDGDYLKAVARDRWDLLSMQLTRAATHVARSRGINLVLRQGRLKSVMVKLVGDQKRAHDDYKKVPFFEPRFKDANGNVLAPKDDGLGYRKASADEVDLTAFAPSEVVVDSTEHKHTAPPRLLDLASLSALLAAKGPKAAEVLACYQRMYEEQVVSYPRTEDKTVTPEQFAELLPRVDAIAELVGVDPASLTHRAPRKSHVKAQGAHGANRPGPNVPKSLADLNKRYGPCAEDIYWAVARNYLAMLAEDFEYDLVKAHVRDYPDFVGETRVATSQGFRTVFDPDAGERDAANERPWSSPAEPFVHEGANKRPQEPTQRWLMKALERYEVGTGASRTSTFADCTAGGDRALISESKGKLDLTECGKASWTLLDGCDIASPEVTERLFSQMAQVGRGEATVDDVTATVAPIVTHDLAVMTANAVRLSQAVAATQPPCPKCGAPMAKAKSGKAWVCTSSKGHRDEGGAWVVDDPGCGYVLFTSVCGKRLTDRQALGVISGKRVLVKGLTSKAGKLFDAYVVLDTDSKFGSRLEFPQRGKGSKPQRVGKRK
ncbi:MAG: hypothetical protein IJ781_14225 [Atopobiaceae bacterium]|nr:hypothetical protein [Atopobiaceae bacterium]